MSTPQDAPKPRRRRLLWGLLGLAILAPALGALAVPRALSGRSGRAWLLAKANRVLAPGRLELAALEFSWFGPTRLRGLALVDAEGDRVLTADRATWDRTLGQVLFRRPKLGTLRIERPVLDVERRPDGTIDLARTLRPLLGGDPRTALRVVLDDGRLRVRGEGIPEPLVAGHADLDLVILPEPAPVSWVLRLANGEDAASRPVLDVVGRVTRGRAGPDGLSVHAKGRGWPWKFGGGDGVVSSGRFGGEVVAGLAGGRWSSSGDATFDDVAATGGRLAGDTLRPGQVRAAWDVAQGDRGWSVRRLDVRSAVGTLQATGEAPGGSGAASGPARVDGQVDLAAVAKQLPHALRLREGVVLERGTAEVALRSTAVDGRTVYDVSAKVSDLRARDGDRPFTLRDPATLAARLSMDQGVARVDRFTADTPFVKGEASGDLAGGLTFKGTVDLANLQGQLRELVDFGRVELAGRGGLDGEYRVDAGRFQGRLRADLRGVKVRGLGPSALDRDAVDLDVRLDGPAGRNGLPGGWNHVRSRLGSGDWSAEWASSADDRHANASVAGKVVVSGRPARVELNAEASADGDAVTIDRATLALVADDPDRAPTPVRLALTGRYDRAKGELTLTSTDARGAALKLADDGFRVVGLGGDGGLGFEGGLAGDLAGLAGWVPDAPEKLQGAWSARASARTDAAGLHLAGKVTLDGLAWGEGDAGNDAGGPVVLSVHGVRSADGTRLDLSELALTSRYATLDASGRVDDLGGEPRVDLRGKFAPDWDALNGWLAANVEPRARVSGRPGAVALRGRVGTHWNDSVSGEFGLAIDGADVYGLRVGPVACVVRADQGKIGIDPIDGTVNGGALHLEPEYRPGDGTNGATLRLGKSARLTDARINDEVSRRVLSFVAPVLDNATRVHGKVSARFDDAVIPLGAGPDRDRGPTVRGSVVFQDVEFVPGPFTDALFGLVGRDEAPSLKLNEPVSLTVADRRVYQKGLALPLGNVSRVELDGWVDFDRNLNLTASLPVTPAMFGNRPVLGDIVSGTKVRVPIRGTLEEPEIDREAFKTALRGLGNDLLGRGLTRGVLGLIEQIGRGRDPNAPPPPPRLTPEQRKEQRIERRDERKKARGRGSDEP